ncbi:hypothetical protein [uncultured Shimia sp.]|uniref:hypothetical protein n=1 Tax=uncultured Shimia sp. TaxID=573152 RepID=UPI00262567D0|nr:hypothetical protein [uncultured Shimia sp.]
MTRFLLSVSLICFLPGMASSESLWNKVKKGASDAGTAVGNTANDVGTAVGNTANDVGTAIDNTVSSTSEMLSDEATPAETRARIDSGATRTLAALLAENPQAQILYDQSYGYAVFDARQVAILGAAAGYGRGVAVVKESGARSYMSMGTGGLGVAFGIGGFERQIVILFETAGHFDDFVRNGYDATAEASSMTGNDNDMEQARFVEGRSFYYLSKNGWRVAATATGTKYWLDNDLN